MKESTKASQKVINTVEQDKKTQYEAPLIEAIADLRLTTEHVDAAVQTTEAAIAALRTSIELKEREATNQWKNDIFDWEKGLEWLNEDYSSSLEDTLHDKGMELKDRARELLKKI